MRKRENETWMIKHLKNVIEREGRLSRGSSSRSAGPRSSKLGSIYEEKKLTRITNSFGDNPRTAEKRQHKITSYGGCPAIATQTQ